MADWRIEHGQAIRGTVAPGVVRPFPAAGPGGAAGGAIAAGGLPGRAGGRVCAERDGGRLRRGRPGRGDVHERPGAGRRWPVRRERPEAGGAAAGLRRGRGDGRGPLRRRADAGAGAGPAGRGAQGPEVGRSDAAGVAAAGCVAAGIRRDAGPELQLAVPAGVGHAGQGDPAGPAAGRPQLAVGEDAPEASSDRRSEAAVVAGAGLAGFARSRRRRGQTSARWRASRSARRSATGGS